jgi:hypothetical protein
METISNKKKEIVMIMPFGDYRGKDLEDIPSDYLNWIINKVTTNDELVEEAEKEYEFRSNWRKHFYSERKS